MRMIFLLGCVLAVTACDKLPVRLVLTNGTEEPVSVGPAVPAVVEEENLTAKVTLNYEEDAYIMPQVLLVLQQFEEMGCEKVRLNGVRFVLNQADADSFTRKRNHFVVYNMEEADARVEKLERRSLVRLKVGPKTPFGLFLDTARLLNREKIRFAAEYELGDKGSVELLEMGQAPTSNVFIAE